MKNDSNLTEYGKMLKQHLYDEHLFFYYELVEKGELDIFCKRMEAKIKEQASTFVDNGLSPAKASEKAIKKLLSEIIDDMPVANKNGILKVPRWMSEKEEKYGIIIEDTTVYGDGKANIRIRMSQHLSMANYMKPRQNGNTN